MEYEVIAEFVDVETGQRIAPGTTFTADEERARRLHKAGVIRLPDGTDVTNAQTAKRSTRSRRGGDAK